MSKQCELTGVKISLGNNVSHAHNKTKRSFTPNLQKKRYFIPELNKNVTLKLSTNAIKTSRYSKSYKNENTRCG